MYKSLNCSAPCFKRISDVFSGNARRCFQLDICSNVYYYLVYFHFLYLVNYSWNFVTFTIWIELATWVHKTSPDARIYLYVNLHAQFLTSSRATHDGVFTLTSALMSIIV
jgi:hypothetical protein